MTQPLDSPNHESAYKYAFALAMLAHLANVESKFLALPAEDFQSLEQTIWAQDMATNFHLVREIGMHKFADYYRKEDLAINCPQGQYGMSLSYSMESQLLGPRVKVLNSISTEQILAKVDEPAQFTGVLLYTNQLRKKLYLILADATKVVVDASEDAKVFLSISHALAEYLAQIDSQLSQQLDIQALAMHIDAIVSHLRQETSSSTCDLPSVFRVFRAMLASQLQVSSANVDQQESAADIVCQLREQGNNLMHISSYPQAIKVYTEAISLCDWTCSNNIPQLYTNRAIAFIGLNCFPEAVSDLNSALRYDRTFSPAWAQLGYCQLNLGFGFLALQCFNTALRAVAGNIYPENFPEDQLMRTKYTENKVRTVVPQFVQRLVQSIILSEKRASQQLQSTDSLREITATTRAILARLRAAAAPEDLNYFAYSLENSFETFRTAASRANSTRPSILTPDIAQDIMAANNMEATAVTILSPITFTPSNRRNATTGVNDASGVNNAPAGAGTDNGPVPPGPNDEASRGEGEAGNPVRINAYEEGLRNILNNFGEALGEMVQTQTLEVFGVPNAQGTQATTTATAPANAPNGTGAASTNDIVPTSVSSGETNTPGGQTSQETSSTDNDSASVTSTTELTPSRDIGPIPTHIPAMPARVTGSVNGAGATNSQTAADFRNSIHNFLPDIRGNLGGIISLALRHHLDTARNLQPGIPNNTSVTTNAPSTTSATRPSVIRIHQSSSLAQPQTQTSRSTALTSVSQNTVPQVRGTNSLTATPQPENGPDSEMPDAPDLD